MAVAPLLEALVLTSGLPTIDTKRLRTQFRCLGVLRQLKLSAVALNRRTSTVRDRLLRFALH